MAPPRALTTAICFAWPAVKPERIQRRRVKGWKLPPNTVCVTRGPGMKWGNPFTVDEFGREESLRRFRAAVLGFMSNGSYCAPVAHPESYIGRIIRDAPIELRGKNLACWCPLDQACHADVLLELANR